MIKNNINSVALVAEKILRVGLNMLVFACLARTLGVENLGQFGLVQAIFFIGHPIALFVDKQLLVRYLIVDKSDCKDLQKTALQLKYSATLLVYVITLFFTYSYYEADFFKLAATYCAIHFLNLDIIYFAYLRAEEKSLEIFKSTAYVIIPMAVLKIVAALIYQNLLIVVVLYCIEAGLISAISWLTFYRHFDTENADIRTEKSYPSARDLISSSCPLVASAVLIILYSRVDLFMIEAKLPAASVGHYTAVVKISEAFSMLMTAYLASQFPRLLKIRKLSADQYNSAMIKTLRGCMLFSMGSIFFTALFAEQILSLLYGQAYLPAKNTLIVHLVGSVFIIQGVICTQWLIAENLQIYRVYRVLAGLVLNIIMNLFLIPKYGILGAACSTLITQVFSSVVFNGFSKPTQPMFKLQLQSMFLYSAKSR